ncbi:MAG: hypothetical protein KA319_00965 [Ferruginibacter sp.]|nr:hypothetical protein [Ferruginibacter sp.]
MGAVAIREKLQAYIKTADDKKVKAIFTMVESDIAKYEWWKDEKLIARFDKDVKDIESGKKKGVTMTEMKNKIAETRKKLRK